MKSDSTLWQSRNRQLLCCKKTDTTTPGKLGRAVGFWTWISRAGVRLEMILQLVCVGFDPSVRFYIILLTCEIIWWFQSKLSSVKIVRQIVRVTPENLIDKKIKSQLKAENDGRLKMLIKNLSQLLAQWQTMCLPTFNEIKWKMTFFTSSSSDILFDLNELPPLDDAAVGER